MAWDGEKAVMRDRLQCKDDQLEMEIYTMDGVPCMSKCSLQSKVPVIKNALNGDKAALDELRGSGIRFNGEKMIFVSDGDQLKFKNGGGFLSISKSDKSIVCTKCSKEVQPGKISVCVKDYTDHLKKTNT